MKISPHKSFLVSVLFFLAAILLELFLKASTNNLSTLYVVLKSLGIAFLAIGIVLQIKLRKPKK